MPSSGAEVANARFLRTFAGTVIGALAVIMTANYLVDPLDLYPPRLFEPMVRSSRVTKLRLLVEENRARPEAIVLGSSRSMQIAPATIARATGQPTFNLSTDSARAEDYYATLRWLVEDAGVTPRLLIIGADVEAFHNHVVPDERLLAIPELAKYLRHGERSGARDDRLRRLVSQQQTYATGMSLARTVWRAGLRTAGLRRGGDPVHTHFEADGYLRYDDWERERAGGRFALDPYVEASVVEYRNRFKDFTGLSEQRTDYFRATLQYARARRIATIVFLTPLHPAVIRALEPLDYDRRLHEVASFLSVETQQTGATFHDFSRIERFAGDPTGFWDGGHMDPANCERLTRRLLETVRAVQ